MEWASHENRMVLLGVGSAAMTQVSGTVSPLVSWQVSQPKGNPAQAALVVQATPLAPTVRSMALRVWQFMHASGSLREPPWSCRSTWQVLQALLAITWRGRTGWSAMNLNGTLTPSESRQLGCPGGLNASTTYM